MFYVGWWSAPGKQKGAGEGKGGCRSCSVRSSGQESPPQECGILCLKTLVQNLAYTRLCSKYYTNTSSFHFHTDAMKEVLCNLALESRLWTLITDCFQAVEVGMEP